METKDGVTMRLEELTEQVQEMIATQAEAITTDYTEKITKVEESLLIPGKVGPVGCEYNNFNEFIKEMNLYDSDYNQSDEDQLDDPNDKPIWVIHQPKQNDCLYITDGWFEEIDL